MHHVGPDGNDQYYYILTDESKRNPALFFAHEFGVRTLAGALVGNPKSRFMEEKFGSKLSSACVGDGQRDCCGRLASLSVMYYCMDHTKGFCSDLQGNTPSAFARAYANGECVPRCMLCERSKTIRDGDCRVFKSSRTK